MDDERGEDEILAMSGYKVRSKDVAEVAKKLEQVEAMLGLAQEDHSLSHLPSEATVHYNPSDLSSWLESMLREVDNLPHPSKPPPPPQSRLCHVDELKMYGSWSHGCM
ncbi:hypothetical protein IFM89_000720 [Coptis chinensis]|nr:hypothetical protein IFM89_000720 [Coptis chinensis]